MRMRRRKSNGVRVGGDVTAIKPDGDTVDLVECKP